MVLLVVEMRLMLEVRIVAELVIAGSCDGRRSLLLLDSVLLLQLLVLMLGLL